MSSNWSVDAWERLAYFGALVVIIGVALEGAELLIKWGKKKKHRRWFSEVFGEHRKRAWVACIHCLKPHILPVESIGFSVLVIGLMIELIAGFTATRLQSKDNAILKAQASSNEVRVATLSNETVRLSLTLERERSNTLVLRRSLDIAFTPRKLLLVGPAIEDIKKFAGTRFAVLSAIDDDSQRVSSSIEQLLIFCGWERLSSTRFLSYEPDTHSFFSGEAWRDGVSVNTFGENTPQTEAAATSLANDLIKMGIDTTRGYEESAGGCVTIRVGPRTPPLPKDGSGR